MFLYYSLNLLTFYMKKTLLHFLSESSRGGVGGAWGAPERGASAMPRVLLGKFPLEEEKKMMDDGENIVSFFFH